MIRAFIQARMSSRRFPGKVLAPFQGRPILSHVIDRVKEAVPSERIVVATSEEPSDDPVACYVERLGISLFRGSLDNVVERFQRCLERYPCDWFVRVCADSPLLNPVLLRTLLTYQDRPDLDLVTNTFPRTFPKGRSLELVASRTFARLDAARLTPEEKEHLTRVYYSHPDQFRILNISSENAQEAEETFAVDTPEDLLHLEQH